MAADHSGRNRRLASYVTKWWTGHYCPWHDAVYMFPERVQI
jgi:hypothetical protein